jgi:hypothetical protein
MADFPVEKSDNTYSLTANIVQNSKTIFKYLLSILILIHR